MAQTFYAQHGSNAKQNATGQPWAGSCEGGFDECVGMESGTDARHVNMFHLSMESIRKNVMARHGNDAMDKLAVDDFIELYTVPTYASVEDFALHHDLVVDGFKFEVQMVDRVADPDSSCGGVIDAERDPLEGIHDTERETTVTYGDAPVPMEEVDLAESGRDHWHFESRKYRNNHHAVIRLKVTAVPPVPAPDSQVAWLRVWDMDMDFFATYHRYAICTCKRTGKDAYAKTAVDTIEGL